MPLESNLATTQNLFLIIVQAVNLAITQIILTNQVQNPLPITIINQVVVNHQIIVNPRIILILVLNPLVVQEAQDLLLAEVLLVEVVDQVVNLEVDLEDINAIYKYHLNF